MQGVQCTRAHRCGVPKRTLCREERDLFEILAHGPAPTLLRRWLEPSAALVVHLTLQVYVEFASADDVTPEFPSDVIRLEFREETPVSTILYVARAAVPGTDANSTISYSLRSESGNSSQFSVDRWTGEVRLRRTLDREVTRFHRLTVSATTAYHHTARQDVLLTVVDSNDHNPVFSQPFYACHVTSDASSYHPICTVTATDLDEGDNGKVVYFLLADDDAVGIFHVDPHSGNIYANRSAPGNRTLTVVAMDAGALPRSSSAPVVVTSDVSPGVKCAGGSRWLAIEENRPAYSVVGAVRLTHDDGTHVAVTRYQLIHDGGSQSFDVDVNTGQIVTMSMLDRERRSEYNLSIAAVHALPGLNINITLHA